MDKKIFDFFDSEGKKNGFGGSESEQTHLRELESVSESLKQLSHYKVDEKYFATILPKFREHQAGKTQHFLLPKVAMSSSFAVVIVLMLMLGWQKMNIDYTNQLQINTDISSANVGILRQESYIAPADEYSDSILNNDKIQTSLDKTIYSTLAVGTISNSDYGMLKSDTDVDQVLSKLDDSELETLYAQLEQTKIL